MILDPDFGLHVSRPDGPQSLYRAVVARSVLDLFGKVIPASEKDEAQLARREALNFLTRESGAWAESRRRLCAACGIDPVALRTNILRILEGGEIIGADTRNSFGGIKIAREFWEKEQTEPARAQVARLAQAKLNTARPKPPRNVKISYRELRAIILPLLSESRQIKDLLFATSGDYGCDAIRKVLSNAVNKGEVVRNDKNHTYVLAA